MASAARALPLDSAVLATGHIGTNQQGRYNDHQHHAQGFGSFSYFVNSQFVCFNGTTKAVASGVPVLGICRGFQEMNVAFGGTLHQKVHEVEGRHDHREDTSLELDVQYGPAHEVVLERGGSLQALTGQDRIQVNSLHSQGVDRLGPGLAVEARALDGLIEAFRVEHAKAFALAVQWHPEWKAVSNPFSRALFAAFGAAARERMR